MRPEAAANRILSTVRAMAKMHEFRVAPDDFIALPREPNTLYSLAVGILGDAASGLANNFINPEITKRPPTWKEVEGAESELVRFAATFFDAYLESRLNEGISVEFSLLCAAAYYLSDGIGSATVVARRATPPPADLGGGLALLARNILLNDFAEFEHETFHSKFISDLLGMLRAHLLFEGDVAVNIPELCDKLRNEVYELGTDRELFYADIVIALCARKLTNSSRNILPPASNLPLGVWEPILRKRHFPVELWPAQKIICDAGLLVGGSAVIQMPTSAGKTRATELIIRSAFLSGRTSLAVIVAPFRSLCHDIRADLSRAFADEDILMDEVSDSYLLDIALETFVAKPSILVVTPEKLLYMLRRAPELAEQIGLVVYDEGHQFEGFTRGPTYELLLSSLRMTLNKNAQVVLISAVIGNAGEIAGWLIGNEKAIVEGKGLLPTAKSIAFASWQKERGWLRYVNPLDPDDEEFFVPRIIEELPLSKKSERERDRIFPDRFHPTDISPSVDIGLYLALHLGRNGSVALFCGQKGSVNKICKRVAEIFERDVNLVAPKDWSDASQIEKLSSLIAKNLGEDGDAAKAAALGVLPHHANIPHGIKVCVEYAMKMGQAQVVACTSTLAQGVNFPIKYLIITATQQGKELSKLGIFTTSWDAPAEPECTQKAVSFFQRHRSMMIRISISKAGAGRLRPNCWILSKPNRARVAYSRSLRIMSKPNRP